MLYIDVRAADTCYPPPPPPVDGSHEHNNIPVDHRRRARKCVYMFGYVYYFQRKREWEKKRRTPATPFAFSVKQQPFPVSLSVRRLRARYVCTAGVINGEEITALFFSFSGCQLLFFFTPTKKTHIHTHSHNIMLYIQCICERTPNGTLLGTGVPSRRYLGDETSTNFLYKTRVPDHCDRRQCVHVHCGYKPFGFSPVFRCCFGMHSKAAEGNNVCFLCTQQRRRTAFRSIL